MPDTKPPPRDDEAIRLFVERMALTMSELGFPRMAARVVYTVMSADDPMTAAEIGERLGVSPAAISGAVRHLTQLGMLIREPVPGSRRDRYRVPEDSWLEVLNLKGGVYKMFADMADEGVRALGEQTPGGRRVAYMRDFFVFVQGEIDGMVARWRASRQA
ncbi:MarR family transcriptional regulator [Micromonospora sp. NPDC049559]|uniref:GbsR/MarR family transcriptional regulator n=1 Tax=Micromonospora sp. NPDC049559 TaxID=3155923 RepID=UPI0034342075